MRTAILLSGILISDAIMEASQVRPHTYTFISIVLAGCAIMDVWEFYKKFIK